MKTNWSWVQRLIQKRALSVKAKDRDEYLAFANWWVCERLRDYLGRHKRPNVKNLIGWSVSNFYRDVVAPDNVLNLNVDLVAKRESAVDQVTTKIDTEEFLKKLNATQATVLQMVLQGFKGNEIAGALRRTPGRISQIRDEIRMAALEHLTDYV